MAKMNRQEMEDFIDILFSFDEEEMKKEYDFIKEYKRLKNENKKMKEDYKLLTDEITGLYNLMNGISITNKYEKESDIEEL